MYIRNFNQQNIEYLKNDFININWQIVLSEMTDPSIEYIYIYIYIYIYVIIILLIF